MLSLTLAMSGLGLVPVCGVTASSWLGGWSVRRRVVDRCSHRLQCLRRWSPADVQTSSVRRPDSSCTQPDDRQHRCRGVHWAARRQEMQGPTRARFRRGRWRPRGQWTAPVAGRRRCAGAWFEVVCLLTGRLRHRVQTKPAVRVSRSDAVDAIQWTVACDGAPCPTLYTTRPHHHFHQCAYIPA